KLGAQRILFGTDWSATWRWISVPTTLHKLRMKVVDDAKLSEADRRLILWDNAVRLFKLEREADAALAASGSAPARAAGGARQRALAASSLHSLSGCSRSLRRRRRKTFPLGRSRLSCRFRPADRPISLRASRSITSRRSSAIRSCSRTRPAPAASSAPRQS